MKLIKVIILFATISSFVVANEGKTLSRLYNRFRTLEQKYSIIQSMVTLDDRTLEPFYFSALQDLIYGDMSSYRNKEETAKLWETVTHMIIVELGDLKGESTSTMIWDVTRTTETPLLKADGLVALGRIQAVEYAPDIALILRNLNFNKNDNSEFAEKVAFGAVFALMLMKEDVGFEPLFYASIGWYQDRVTEIAHRAITTSYEDPVPLMIPILTGSEDYEIQRRVLSTAMQMDTPPEKKIEIVMVALVEGLEPHVDNATLKEQLSSLRKDAIGNYVALNLPHTSAPRLLDKSITRGDLDEKIVAIEALGRDGSNSATQVLVQRLDVLNERQISGVTLNREQLVLLRQIIFALSISGNEQGLAPLNDMAYIDYTPALKKLAQEAIEKIQNR